MKLPALARIWITDRAEELRKLAKEHRKSTYNGRVAIAEAYEAAAALLDERAGGIPDVDQSEGGDNDSAA